MSELPYTFDKEKHIHTLAGRPLHGVTTVLSVIAKPMLIQWAANMAVDYVKANATGGGLLDYLVTNKVLEEARSAHRKKKEKAGDWGTEVHQAIEQWIAGFVPVLKPDQQIVLDKLKAWSVANNVKWLSSEKHVWSEELWIGGICDFTAEINGKKYIGDFKTSSGIYNEAFFQIAAYDLCMQEMGLHKAEDIAGYIVINLKKDGGFQTKIVTDKQPHEIALKSALSLYKVIKSL